MDNVIAETQHAAAIFDGVLVVGKHDTVTLLGSSAQAKLRDYSRTISKLFVADKDDLNNAIEDVVAEIEKFESISSTKPQSLFNPTGVSRQIAKEYNELVSYIEQVSLFFQLQQAQLLKEIKLLEKLAVSVQDSVAALEECIEVGAEVLAQRAKPKNGPALNSQTIDLYEEDNTDVWYSRLERRIDDLRISHTAALQNQAQIKLLYENNLTLLDRVSAAITNTFPVWKNQMATLLGIEAYEKRLKDQDKVFATFKKSSWWKTRKSDITQRKQLVDLNKVTEANYQLRRALKEAVSLEKKDTRIRCDFQEIVNNMERGQSND